MQRPKTLWKSRAVEKPKNRLFHRAWKSRQERGIPTFPQRRRRLDELQQPDISLATKSGHFNLLRTAFGDCVQETPGASDVERRVKVSPQHIPIPLSVVVG